MGPKKVDIFGSFLTGVPSAPPVATPAATDSQTSQAAPIAPSPDLEKAVLALLSRAEEPVDLKVLLAETMGSPTQMIQLLGDMEKVKLVKRVEGEGDGRRYSATPLGKDLSGVR